jgi:GNAT superfamily N-acetyltransferase
MKKTIEQIRQMVSEMDCRYISHSKTEPWGASVLIMEKRGRAFGRIYWYHDDSTTVYLDCLSVDEKMRKKGIGTNLQEIREQIGLYLNATTSCLWVKRDTWMYKWYKRRGYEYWIDYNEENAIWMRKSLI